MSALAPGALGSGGLALVVYDVPDASRARLAAEAARLTGRAVEVIALAGEPGLRPAALRNRALAEAHAPYVAFVEPEGDLESSFLEHACRLLDRRELDFVTAWADALPLQSDSEPRACEPAWLLGRPWFAHIPSVLRRSAVAAAGGYDESLAACEDADLLLRLLARGGGLALVDARPRHRPWGPGIEWDHDDAPAAYERFHEKHRALFAAEWERVLVGKERLARELFAHRREVDARWQALHRELAQAQAEVTRARAELEGGAPAPNGAEPPTMGKTRFETRVIVHAPIERVFERITDHEAMSQWPGVSKCRLIVEGTPRNGLGAVRRVTAGGLTLDEQVVQFEPPRRYDYSIIKGLPVVHRGTVSLSEVDGGVEVCWRIELTSRVPLLAQALGTALRLGLPRALRYFAAQTSAAP